MMPHNGAQSRFPTSASTNITGHQKEGAPLPDNMHDSDQTDDELDEEDPTYEDEDDSSSDAGARRRGRSRRVGTATAARKRMSILTSRYFDVPRPPPMSSEPCEDCISLYAPRSWLWLKASECVPLPGPLVYSVFSPVEDAVLSVKDMVVRWCWGREC